MNNDQYSLKKFVIDCRKVVLNNDLEPVDCIEKTAPAMIKLLNGDKSFLKSEYIKSNPHHYARNAIYIDPDDVMSLYAVVWLPGQWTPIHDHGTWGVIGVLEGVLEERNFIRTDLNQNDIINEKATLVRGSILFLTPGAISSFIPNPDHIHITGNSNPNKRAISLHLYGNAMSGYHTYDKATGTRKWIEVSHNVYF